MKPPPYTIIFGTHNEIKHTSKSKTTKTAPQIEHFDAPLKKYSHFRKLATSHVSLFVIQHPLLVDKPESGRK